MRARILSLVIALAAASVALAELTVDVRAVQAVVTTIPTTVTQLTLDDGTPLGEPVTSVGESVTQDGAKASVLVLTSSRDLADANNVLVRIKCATASVTKLSPTMWFVDAAGTHRVDVVVLAQLPLSWDEATVQVVNGPKPAPPPPPPPPVPIANEYGVGQPAYEHAPRHAETADSYAAIYRQAGDFLFGIPSLKFVTSTTDAHNNDPNRSVMAWISQQYNMVQCPDEETCKQWGAWRAKVRQAIIDSQADRQFTRQDWYEMFNEVASALSEVANGN